MPKIILALLFLFPSFALADNTLPGSLDYNFEISSFMLHSAYRNIKKLDRDDAPDGAYGPVNQRWDQTHEGKWFIESQRYGGDLVDGGVATQDFEAIARGLHIIQWGFEQQQPDGSFDCPDHFHSGSFFIEATAHAILLLRSSGLDAQFQSQINDILPKLHAAALWMIGPSVEAKGIEKNKPYTHRRYLVAAALGETGVLVGDSALIEESRTFIKDGLSMQVASGYNPEKGGYDSSYNAVGITFAERYYAYVADGSLKDQLYQMLTKAVAWEASRITDDGQITAEGNSRVGGENTECGRSGALKKMDVGHVLRCFAYWSMISNDPSYLQLAQKVAIANRFWK